MGRTFSSRTDVLSPVRVAGPAVAAHPHILVGGCVPSGCLHPESPRGRALRVLPPPYAACAAAPVRLGDHLHPSETGYGVRAAGARVGPGRCDGGVPGEVRADGSGPGGAGGTRVWRADAPPARRVHNLRTAGLCLSLPYLVPMAMHPTTRGSCP